MTPAETAFLELVTSDIFREDVASVHPWLRAKAAAAVALLDAPAPPCASCAELRAVLEIVVAALDDASGVVDGGQGEAYPYEAELEEGRAALRTPADRRDDAARAARCVLLGHDFDGASSGVEVCDDCKLVREYHDDDPTDS